MEKNTQKKKKRLIILGIVFALFLCIGLYIGSVAGKNVTAMNRAIDSAMAELEKHYTVTAVDPGEYKEMKIYGIMKFDVEQYDVKDLGNLSIMRVNMGVMQMATFVVTPQDKNLPLLSADYMYMLDNRMSYLEFYNLVESQDDTYKSLVAALDAVQAKYAHLENLEVSTAWYDDLLTSCNYKSGTSKDDAELEQMLIDGVSAYLTESENFPLLTAEEKAVKKALTVDYCNGLVEKGGVSTDVFKSSLGEETTKDFFHKVFFGTTAE